MEASKGEQLWQNTGRFHANITFHWDNVKKEEQHSIRRIASTVISIILVQG